MANNDIFENLEETLFDSHMPVNIKWVSNKFHIDVNNAKKIMYEFAQKKKTKVKLNVFVSGELKSTKQSIMTVKQGLQFDAMDKYLKDNFSKVSSAHIQEILPLEQDSMEETDPTNLYRKIEHVDNLQDKLQLQCAFAKMRNLTIEDYRKVKKESTSSKLVPSSSKPSSTTPNTTSSSSKSSDKKTTPVDKLFSKSKSSDKESYKEAEIKIKEEKKVFSEKVEKTKSPQKLIETPTKKTPEKKVSQKQIEKKDDTKKRKRTTKKDAGKGDINFDEEDEEVDETPASPKAIKDQSESEEEEEPKEKKSKKATPVKESPKNSMNKYTKSPSKEKTKKTRRVKKIVEEQDAKGYFVSKEVWVEEEYSEDDDDDVKMEESKPEVSKKPNATPSKQSTTAKKPTSQSIMNFFKKK